MVGTDEERQEAFDIQDLCLEDFIYVPELELYVANRVIQSRGNERMNRRLKRLARKLEDESTELEHKYPFPTIKDESETLKKLGKRLNGIAEAKGSDSYLRLSPMEARLLSEKMNSRMLTHSEFLIFEKYASNNDANAFPVYFDCSEWLDEVFLHREEGKTELLTDYEILGLEKGNRIFVIRKTKKMRLSSIEKSYDKTEGALNERVLDKKQINPYKGRSSFDREILFLKHRGCYEASDFVASKCDDSAGLREVYAPWQLEELIKEEKPFLLIIYEGRPERDPIYIGAKLIDKINRKALFTDKRELPYGQREDLQKLDAIAMDFHGVMKKNNSENCKIHVSIDTIRDDTRWWFQQFLDEFKKLTNPEKASFVYCKHSYFW